MQTIWNRAGDRLLWRDRFHIEGSIRCQSATNIETTYSTESCWCATNDNQKSYNVSWFERFNQNEKTKNDKFEFILYHDSYRSIISNSNFFEANSNDLKATNMFLFIKPRHLENHPSDVEFELHEDITFPSTCRTTVLNIENPMENMSLNCCKNLNVYNDMLPNAEKSEEDITKAHTGMSEMTANLSSYFICKVCVKGFKDQLVKGTSIWTI